MKWFASCLFLLPLMYMPPEQSHHAEGKKGVALVVLGTVQDAGSPHIGCKKDCCNKLWGHPEPERKVVSLGIIDYDNKKYFLFEATPDFTSQVQTLKELASLPDKAAPDGIFVTHAHIGHYTGLMYLGKEAMMSKNTPVYCMPKMKTFLETNGPWSQLVQMQNIQIQPMSEGQTLQITPQLKITAIKVPHRDEYSETAGFIVEGPEKKVLFIPDIDKWSKWERDITGIIKMVDYAFLDATFYDSAEINYRSIADIPHPFVIESMELFANLSTAEKRKVHFIHFNHTNTLLLKNSVQSKTVLDKGFNIARYKDCIPL